MLFSTLLDCDTRGTLCGTGPSGTICPCASERRSPPQTPAFRWLEIWQTPGRRTGTCCPRGSPPSPDGTCTKCARCSGPGIIHFCYFVHYQIALFQNRLISVPARTRTRRTLRWASWWPRPRRTCPRPRPAPARGCWPPRSPCWGRACCTSWSTSPWWTCPCRTSPARYRITGRLKWFNGAKCEMSSVVCGVHLIIWMLLWS